MLKSFAGSDVATQFHQAYYLQLLREVLAVMTDTFHTPGFKLHCRILLHLFGIVRGEAVIKAPLWDVTVGGWGRAGRCLGRLQRLFGSASSTQLGLMHACVLREYD
jgi:hypothetical protein